MSFQTCMAYFPLWNTRGGYKFFVHKMKFNVALDPTKFGQKKQNKEGYAGLDQHKDDRILFFG